MACIQWCPQNAISHPKVSRRRKRYTHPKVSIQNLWKENGDKKILSKELWYLWQTNEENYLENKESNNLWNVFNQFFILAEQVFNNNKLLYNCKSLPLFLYKAKCYTSSNCGTSKVRFFFYIEKCNYSFLEKIH